MKHIIIFSIAFSILFFTSPPTISAQENASRYKIGPTEETIFSDLIVEFLGESNSNYLVLRQTEYVAGENAFYLQEIDKTSLATVQKKKLEGFGLEDYHYSGMEYTAKGLFLEFSFFFSPYKRDLGDEPFRYLKEFRLDLPGLTLVEDSISIRELQDVESKYRVIPDGSAIRYPLMRLGKSPNVISFCSLCGANYGELNNITPSSLAYQSFHDLYLDGSGRSINIPPSLNLASGDLYTLKIDNSKEDQSKAKFILKLKNVLNENEDSLEVEVQKDYRLSHGILMKADAQHIAIVGYYSESADPKVFAGVFYIKVDPTMRRIIQETYHPFSEETLSQIFTESTLKRKRKRLKAKGLTRYTEIGIPSLKIGRMLIAKNGNIMIVSEQNRISRARPADADPIEPNYNLDVISDNLIVTTLSSSGSFAWEAVVKKKQKLNADEKRWGQYAVGFDGDNLYFVFNDHADNQNKEVHEEFTKYLPYYGKGAINTMYVKVDSEGNTTRKLLVRRSKTDVDIAPSIFFQPTDKELIIMTSQRLKRVGITRGRAKSRLGLIKVYLE